MVSQLSSRSCLFLSSDQQREEQRIRKQTEKERNRRGIDDQWADRFVYHKTAEHISPRRQK